MTDWAELTQKTLEELKTCDERFRPTNFWGPGLEQLLTDMEERGLENLKRWPTAGFWFYPMYGNRFTNATISEVFETARAVNPAAREPWMRGALTGSHEARRDFDAARLSWDRERWPINLARFGESRVGNPMQLFRLTGNKKGWTRPYLNYMLCMTALSHHVDAPPKSVLELGGGYGVLGEFLMRRDPELRYVDLDIPPLVTVASYYLRRLFEDRVMVPDEVASPSGPIDIPASAVLPNWRLPDVSGPFDLFVNSFSFQEMEPEVVEHYIDLVAAKDVEFAVSLNSRLGKPRVADGHKIGVLEPVTSAFIIERFEKRGYTLMGRYGAPLLHSAGELSVLRRTDALARSRSLGPRVRRAASRLRRR